MLVQQGWKCTCELALSSIDELAQSRQAITQNGPGTAVFAAFPVNRGAPSGSDRLT